MASVTSLSDENLILLHDLKTTCFLDGYSCHLSNDNFTVTEPEQLSYWLKEITYSELSPESATLFKSEVYHCDCCTTGTCSSSISYSCSACDEPYYSSNDYFTLYKDGSSLYSFVSYSAHDETEYPDDYCSDEDWQEYLEEKAFRDNR